MLKISIFPPKSILEAIADSPLSLQIDTANSVKIDIPVTFNSILIKFAKCAWYRFCANIKIAILIKELLFSF